MKYKEAIINAMKNLAEDEKVFFLGYNICKGSQAYGTLKEVPANKCLEMPVAENLMMGFAIGMSVEGYKPLVFFERHDFILNALDEIVNHLDKIGKLSREEFKVPMIIRATVGGKKPLYPGPQHTQDFTEALKQMVAFPVIDLRSVNEVVHYYKIASKFESPIMLVERRDLYDLEDIF